MYSQSFPSKFSTLANHLLQKVCALANQFLSAGRGVHSKLFVKAHWHKASLGLVSDFVIHFYPILTGGRCLPGNRVEVLVRPHQRINAWFPWRGSTTSTPLPPKKHRVTHNGLDVTQPRRASEADSGQSCALSLPTFPSIQASHRQ